MSEISFRIHSRNAADTGYYLFYISVMGWILKITDGNEVEYIQLPKWLDPVWLDDPDKI